MPSCPTCTAFVDEKGKHAPAKHLSEVVTERDKAVREAGELRWAVGSLSAEVAKARAERDDLFEQLKQTRFRIDHARAHLSNGAIEGALKSLNGDRE